MIQLAWRFSAERLDGLRTPEGEPIPPNTLAELRRDMVRRRLVSDQIRQIAVLRFTTISNLVGNCTGRSPGFSPRRMRST
jgi:hypothetical protein